MASPKNPTKHNDSPNTPGVNESDVARMKADELRNQLKRRGVKGTAELKKPELVKQMIKALVAEDAAASKKSAAPKKTLKASDSKASDSKASTGKAGKAGRAGKNPTSHNDTPNTPEVNESDVARMKVAELRRRLADRGVKGTDELKKPELVKQMIKALTSDAKAKPKAGADKASKSTSKAGKASTGKASTGKAGTGKADAGNGAMRTGKQMPSSLKYSQEITSTEDRPERAGRSLVTTDHEVIRQWALKRKAVPSTVKGTEHGGHLGVLRFDFPGYTGDRLAEVSWEDWLATFDKRRLNFIYQEKLSSGKRSNFFQLQSPDGEDD
ncbi:MAG TPA: hypothetical protein VF657_15215 [Actinoplanes sp.]